MPWDSKSFREKHNHGISGEAADKAAKQATAIVKSGGDEGMAIATANKNAAKMKRRYGGKS